MPTVNHIRPYWWCSPPRIACDIKAEDVGAYGWSFVLALKNRKWMKPSDFAQLLNAMYFTRAKFGHLMVKKVERPGEPQIQAVPWRDIITDKVHITEDIPPPLSGDDDWRVPTGDPTWIAHIEESCNAHEAEIDAAIALVSSENLARAEALALLLYASELEGKYRGCWPDELFDDDGKRRS